MIAVIVFGVSSILPVVMPARPGAQNAAARAEQSPDPATPSVIELENSIQDLRKAGRPDAAIVLAVRAAEALSLERGNDDYRVRHAYRRVDTLKHIAALPKADQWQLAVVYRSTLRAEELLSERKCAEAAVLCGEQLPTSQRLLGAEHPESLQLAHLMAQASIKCGHFEAVEGLLLETLRRAQGTWGPGDPYTLEIARSLARVYRSLNKLAAAEALYQEVADTYAKTFGISDRKTQEAVYDLAGVQQELGKLREAEAIMSTLVSLNEDVLAPDDTNMLILRSRWANILAELGIYSKAAALHREVLGRRQIVLGDEHKSTLRSMSNLALVFHEAGQLSEAEVLYRRILAIRIRLHGPGHLATANTKANLGALLRERGRFAEAERHEREALDVRRKELGSEHRKTLIAMNNLAKLMKASKRYEQAASLYREVLDIRLRVLGAQDKDTLKSMSNLGIALLAINEAQQAEQLLRALVEEHNPYDKDHPLTLEYLHNLAGVLADSGKVAEAEPLYDHLIATRTRLFGEDHRITAQSSLSFGRMLCRLDRLEEAEPLLEQASRSYKISRRQASATGLGRLSYDAASPLPWLAVCEVRRGHPRDAWSHIESNLARGLFDAVSRKHALSETERVREEALVGQLDMLDQLLYAAASESAGSGSLKSSDELRLERQQLLAELSALQNQRQAATDSQPFDLKRIQASLPPRTALIGWVDLVAPSHTVYWPGEHWGYIVRDQGPPRWARLLGTGPGERWTPVDDELPATVRAALTNPQKPVNAGLARRLYRQRIAPLEPHLEAVDQLIVLPAGALGSVPIEFLVDKYTVSYAPSASMMAWLRERSPSVIGRPTLMAAGDPQQHSTAAPVGVAAADERSGAAPGASSRQLPGARREVLQLQKLFASSRHSEDILILLGQEVSRPRLDQLGTSGKLERFRYVHLATHGVMDDRYVLSNALEVLPAGLKENWESGHITADHIAKSWQLDADLVTLSACETAMGRVVGGEGMLGFSQALFTAGARSLLLSLWKVHDDATMLLMVRFYENLLGRYEGSRGNHPIGQPMTRAAALAEAKRWLRELSVAEVRTALRISDDKDWLEFVSGLRGIDISRTVSGPRGRPAEKSRPFEHPFYWAAFILIGAPQ